MKKLTTEELCRRLAAGEIVPCSAEQWKELAGEFPVKTAIATGLAGDLLLVRRPVPGPRKTLAWALVEQPGPGLRVVRPFAREAEAKALIAERMAAYERMWDG